MNGYDRHHYPQSWDDFPEPHGTTALTRHLLVDLPDTYRSYGRRMVRSVSARCAKCQAIDAAHARLRRMHTAYHRRTT